MRRQRVLLVVVLLIAAAAGTVSLQHDLRSITGEKWKRESMTYLPRSDRIKPFLLGFETTVAHYLWIRTVLYFGGHQMSDRDYRWLIDMLDGITRLCPWFYPAYEFAGILVPDVCDNPDAARVLLERGMWYLGAKKWNIGFNLGVIYLKYYDDRKIAAEYFARAALTPGAPRERLMSMANTFFSQAGTPVEGLNFLMFAYETSDNPEVRTYLSEKISALQKEFSGGLKVPKQE
ncbi:MAG: hypothetical protein JW863_05920 [Chitinispirillaceae bacterium]|nr:hypothetical protein [Chitinispirillaceae bacterium]